ncbi:MAG: molybdopterin-dependent oxidoreductase [Gemmatimonadota bacterium]
MSTETSRRAFLGIGLSAAGTLLLPGCRSVLPPSYGSLIGLGDTMTFAAHRLLLPRMALAQEFDRSKISAFPAINTTDPKDETYQRHRAANFVDWRLPVDGLVTRPLTLSLEDLKRFPARTQITQHSCERGWSAIGEWTGVTLGRVLEAAGIQAEARYVVFRCYDRLWDSIDLIDAFHPQTLLAYGMNGGEVPVPHGAPIRLRVERQLGYKNLKFLRRITVVDRLDGIEKGKGSLAAEFGYSWYAGI